MKRKKSYSIIIAVCLIFVLSGCTSASNDPNKTGQESNNQTNNSSSAAQDKNNQGGGSQMNASQESNAANTTETNNTTADGNETGTNGTATHESGNNETGNSGTATHDTGNNQTGNSGSNGNQTNGTQTAETQNGDIISEKEAKQIALEKVPGAVEADIKDFHVENKKNFIEYEGEIIYNGKEYEFEIDGHDGTILEWEVEDVK